MIHTVLPAEQLNNKQVNNISIPEEVSDNMLVKEDNSVEKATMQPFKSDDAVVVTQSPIKEEINSKLINDLNVGLPKNSFARLAVNEEDPDRFLNIEEDKVTRSKLGGIIRQVKRVVERNTKIKTSNGLRIGGFEIAIK